MEYYCIEALVKIESPDPAFITRYEWLVLQVEHPDEDLAMEKAKAYLDKHYNRSYQGGVPIQLSVHSIIAINPAITTGQEEVKEVYSLKFNNLALFEEWRKEELR